MNKKRLADSVSLLAAFGASLCCVGPFVAVALGFGAAAGAVSAFFAPWRPWLLAVAFGIVGWRLFVLYRPADGVSVECVTSGRACAPEGRGRERLLTWGILCVVAVFAASSYLVALIPMSPRSVPALGAAVPNPAATENEICLLINGMTCSACAKHVEAALADIPGVASARVDYDAAEACIALTIKNPAPPARMIGAVESAGYRARLKSGGSPG